MCMLFYKKKCNGIEFSINNFPCCTGAGAVDYIIDHAEIDVVFIQDKKIKEV